MRFYLDAEFFIPGIFMKSKALILGLSLAGIYFLKAFWWDPSSVEEKIDDTFFSKNYPKFQELVLENGNMFTEGKKHLLLAYGYSGAGDLSKSNEELDIAIQQLDNTPQLNLEIVLNQALNAYLGNDLPALNMYIDQINVEKPVGRQWKRVFQGALALKLDNCSEALQYFSKPLPFEALNPLMHQVFTEKLPPAWTSLQLASCEIGMGKYREARTRVSQPGLIHTEYEGQLAHTLMGKSYLLEGNTKNSKDSIIYYGLAIGELGKVAAGSVEAEMLKKLFVESLQTRLQGALASQQIDQVLFFESALSHYQKPELNQVLVAVKETPFDVKSVVKEHLPQINIEDWEYETPLDWNYAMIQGRIDSILDGDKLWVNLDEQLEEDSVFLNLLTQIQPPLSPVFFLLGQVELLRDHNENARRAFEAYVNLEPENVWGWKLLALAQISVGDRSAAEKSFKEAIKINPVDLAAWKSLGKIYVEESNGGKATHAYENALRMDPFDVNIILALNQLYYDQQNKELALGLIHGVYRNHQGNPLILQALQVTMGQVGY